jgi:cell division protein FtsB
MSYEEIRERLRGETAKIAVKTTVLPFRADPSPRPGDLFAPPELGEFPAEVAIVEHDPAAGRFRVVPVDDYPQVGGNDVEFRLDDLGSLARARCDLALWLDASRLNVASRTGALPLMALDEIRRKSDAIAAGTVRVSLYEEEVDSDPDYRRWKDQVLKSALAALEQPKARWRVLPWRSLAAAMVLLAGAWWGLRQVNEMRHRLEARGEEIARLEAEATSLRAENRDLDARSQALERYVRAVGSEAVQPNLPFAFLNYSSVRRGEHTVLVAEGAGSIALVVEVVDPEPYQHYGLRIVDRESGREVLGQDGLELESGNLLSLGLPASLLPPGDYQVTLSGFRDGAARALEEGFLLHVRRPADAGR